MHYIPFRGDDVRLPADMGKLYITGIGRKIPKSRRQKCSIHEIGSQVALSSHRVVDIDRYAVSLTKKGIGEFDFGCESPT